MKLQSNFVRAAQVRGTPTDTLPPHVRAVLHRLVNDAATQSIAAGLEAEVDGFLQRNAASKLPEGSQTIVRNGFLPPRTLLTSVGDVQIRVPRTRNRGAERNTFQSVLLPPYSQRARMDSRLSEAFLYSALTQSPMWFLEILLGVRTQELPAALQAHLISQWRNHLSRWMPITFTGSSHLCWWSGLLPISMLHSDDSTLHYLAFVIAFTEDGHHELVEVNLSRGDKELDWFEMLARLRRRGLRNGPQLHYSHHTPALARAVSHAFPSTRFVQ